MKIGIVGGSIAGCSAAILLYKEGHDVSVFERSNKTLVGRGGGIGTTPSLLNQIRSDDLIGNDFISFQVNSMPFIGKKEEYEPYGRRAWSMPMNFRVFQWNELWHHLRLRVPDECYHGGVEITGARSTSSGAIQLENLAGTKMSFDLVLFADGYNSLGRRLLFPDQKLKYRGYVLWRGLLPESEMQSDLDLEDEILRLSYGQFPGHNVVYFIPSLEGATDRGMRMINWAAYIAIEENDLGVIMTDHHGKIRSGTLPPGAMTLDTEIRMKQFLASQMPGHYAEIIEKTRDSYIQVIYTLDLDDYHKDRMCLIGDAGIVVQPFTGSGVFKGYNNVKDLIECLSDDMTLEESLAGWGEKQIARGKRLLALGEQMERAFIWNPPDFAHAEKARLKKWWKESVTFPENFNYQKG
jgi:2-polyprenyl-6-methoxyphenol hydroxylase-like FAD-dependent oxidoreductase